VHGTLTVTDPTTFATCLARGVGRHVAYGYGMLMLRPPKKARTEELMQEQP
jgi:CRISPR system Cascade subunit CasE